MFLIQIVCLCLSLLFIGCSSGSVLGSSSSNDVDSSITLNPDKCIPNDDLVVLGARVKPPVLIDIPPVKFGAPPLVAGMGPDTAEQCAKASAALPGQSTDPNVIRSCFFDTTNTPQATIERVLEKINDVSYIHVRLTFNPYFVDNSYGINAIGWANSKSGKHNFSDLVGSDHAELILTDKNDIVVLRLKLDYISTLQSQVSGYGSLGVTGGDGSVLVGSSTNVLKVTTSLTRNLNFCGYKDYTIDSPATDLFYTPNPATPNWDYRVVYEMWVDSNTFGTAGLGDIFVQYVHASPSKLGTNTLTVEDKPCPPNEEPDSGTPSDTPDSGTPSDTPDSGVDGGFPDSGVPVEEICPPGFVPRPPNYWGDVL